jgi:hypothetical protein
MKATVLLFSVLLLAVSVIQFQPQTVHASDCSYEGAILGSICSYQAEQACPNDQGCYWQAWDQCCEEGCAFAQDFECAISCQSHCGPF